MGFQGILAGLILPLIAWSQDLRAISRWPSPGLLRGGGGDPLSPGRLFTWGQGAHVWEGGRPTVIASTAIGFDGGGCVLDADGDGHVDLILSRRSPSAALGELVWLPGPRFVPRVIDSGVVLHDCVPAALFGRAGFLIIHRESQVRFYHFAHGAFAVRELYSIYTDSRQAGLALSDVDADGFPDIIAGNYWVRSPGRFDLPWHIFAIHLHHQTRDAARFAYAVWPQLIVGVQRDSTRASVRIFRRPADPRLLWIEEFAPGVELNRPQAAARFGPWAVIGHSRGLLVLDPISLQHRKIPGPAPIALWEAAGSLYAVSPGTVSVWRR